MATNTSELGIFPAGDRQNPATRSPYLAYKHTQLTADTKASSEEDLRSWSKSDRKLYENLQRCRERFAKKQSNDPVEPSGGTAVVSKKTGLDYLPGPRYEDVKRLSSKCPQFMAVSDGKDYTSKRKSYTVTPRSRSLLDLSKGDDKDERKTGIVFKLPIQVTRLKVEKGAETVSQTVQNREARKRALAEQAEINNSEPPPPTPITIPTGMFNSNNNNTALQHLENPTRSSSGNLLRKVPKRRIVRVAAICGDASPSVSSTAHVLLEKKLSKVTYIFPDVLKPATAEPDSSFYSTRNASRLDSSIVYVKTPESVAGSTRDSPRGVSLPRLPKHCSPYHWSADPIDFVSDCNSVSKDVSSEVSSSVKTPPTVSLPNTPDSDRQYVQTGDGVFVLNILRSMTVSSLSRMSSSPIHMFRHRDNSSIPSSRV